MEIRRYVLFAALAVLSYLLLQQWNADYGQPEQVVSVAQTDIASVDETSTINQDTSVAPITSDGSATVVPSSVGQVASTGLINVRTDVLHVQIDPKGGDIEYVALPQYPLTLDQPDVPFVLLENNDRRHYIAQSGLWGENGIDQGDRPLYYASSQQFEMDGDELEVTLSYSQDQIEYQKVFHFTKGDYLIDVTYRINNQSGQSWKGNMFGQLKRDQSKDPISGQGIGMASALAYAWTTPDSRYDKISFDDIEDGVENVVQTGGWVAFLQHYFVSAWVPSQEETSTYFLRTAGSGQYRGGFSGSSVTVPAGETAELSASLFVGPKIQERLEQVSEHLELSVDYGWLWWAAQPLFAILTAIQSVVINWGWSIILLTVLVKIAFYPLTASSYKSMAKMRKFAPKMAELRERFGDDRQKLSQEMMKMYQKEKINPMGGCLPMVIQMPVFIALYWVLLEAVELRQSPWIFWIEDLSVKDPTFILPILMAASMFLQMQLSAQPSMDPMQAKMMKAMPLVFGVMFLWFPSGLVLYWLVNNLITIAQQYYINKQIEKGNVS